MNILQKNFLDETRHALINGELDENYLSNTVYLDGEYCFVELADDKGKSIRSKSMGSRLARRTSELLEMCIKFFDHEK